MYYTKMLSDLQKARIIQLRGLGYRQKEIAETLGISQARVAYHLNELRELSLEKGADQVYLQTLVAGFGPKAVEFLSRLEGLRKLA